MISPMFVCHTIAVFLQGLKFTRFPYLLTLQLKRFDFDYSTMHRIKLNDRMSFPHVLNLNKFVNASDMVGGKVG